jgi:hypothetical protein
LRQRTEQVLVVIRRGPRRLRLCAARRGTDCARRSNEEVPSGGSWHRNS